MNCLRSQSLDDDDAFSNISRISCGLQNSLHSIYNSDSECGGPISVRDMIQHYNNHLKQNEANNIDHKYTYKLNAAKKYHHNSSQHLLAATKSSYCGLNNYCSNIICCKRLQDDHHLTNTCCKSCTAFSSCRNGNLRNSLNTKISSTPASTLNENNKNFNNNYIVHSSCENCLRSFKADCNKINAKDSTHILAVENCGNATTENGIDTTATSANNNSNVLNNFCTELSLDCGKGLFKNHSSQNVVEERKNRLLSDSTEEATHLCQQQQPKPSQAETTYQSKTTIAKTSSGVRIIIDIFFDQEQCTHASDIVGSRVETDIPQSRILDEFQQQTMGAKNSAATIS